MKIQTECLPCLLKRILFETELSTTEKKRQTKALRTACAVLAEHYDPKECSATIATKLHKSVYEAVQDKDPYAELKHTSNLIAASLVPKIQGRITTSPDPL
jgi:uncharacterized protein with ATP-grasp and redox domains